MQFVEVELDPGEGFIMQKMEGDGLFFAVLRGPGTVWLQSLPFSLPFSRLALRVFAAAPKRGGSHEEGSMLGGLGNVVDGGDD